MSKQTPLTESWFEDLGERAYVAAYDKNTDVIRLAVAQALEWAADTMENTTAWSAWHEWPDRAVLIRAKAEEVRNNNQEKEDE